jgi:hypothetical protein
MGQTNPIKFQMRVGLARALQMNFVIEDKKWASRDLYFLPCCPLVINQKSQSWSVFCCIWSGGGGPKKTYGIVHSLSEECSRAVRKGGGDG